MIQRLPDTCLHWDSFGFYSVYCCIGDVNGEKLDRFSPPLTPNRIQMLHRGEYIFVFFGDISENNPKICLFFLKIGNKLPKRLWCSESKRDAYSCIFFFEFDKKGQKAEKSEEKGGV